MTYTVADLVSEFLAGIGVQTAFGIISVHNIPMMDAITRRNRIRIVPARGEAGGAHMADGFARACGGIGVLITSTGPGAANAAGGLFEAWTASTPLLHITGQSKSEHIERGRGTTHETKDQTGMLASVGKGSYRIRSAGEALGTLTRAWHDAMMAPQGPVSVEIPADVQRTRLMRPDALDHLTLPDVSAKPSGHALEHLAQMVRRARRPMLWLGSGARSAGPAALKLMDLGFGCVSSWQGRGIVAEAHPMSLGAMNGGGIPMIEDFYADCDLMVVAGSRLRGHETVDFSVKLPDPLVQIDVDPSANGRTYPNSLFVHGDTGTTLATLAGALTGWTPDPAFRDDFAALKSKARAAFRATLGPYCSFAEQLQPMLDTGAIFARDVTINHSTWGHRLTQLGDPTQNIYPVAAGIGQGLSLAIGAALADGRKTICMTGDGGFMLNVGELWTVIQEQVDLTILVMNDAGYGVIRHIQDATGAGRSQETLAMPDLAELAKTAGLPFWRVSKPGEFGPKTAEAFATHGPSLVEIDMTAIGPHPPYFPYGPKAEAVD
ncbi:MAG: thiamine pyrophosphate-binding protein [Paracoccaceae bacterium]